MILVLTFMLLFHLTKTIQDVNMGMPYNLKRSSFAIDYVIICVFQKIKDFCIIVKIVIVAREKEFFGA